MIITTDEQNAEFLAEVAWLMDTFPECAADSPEGRRLIELATAIEAYEKVRYPI